MTTGLFLDEFLETKITTDCLWTYTIDDTDYSFYKVEKKLTLPCPISWLSNQNLYPLIFWKSKEDEKTLIGLSSILSYDHIPKVLCKKRGIGTCPQLFGGCYFSQNTTQYDIWNQFAKPGFFLPEIFLEIDLHGECTISFHVLDNTPDILNHLETLIGKLNFNTQQLDSFDKSFLDRVDVPNYANWCNLVKKALNHIETTPLEKVVLARTTYISFKEEINPFEVLKKMTDTALNTTSFAWIPSKTSAFLGTTPEKLYSRNGRNISTEAVAGTRPRGATIEEDQLLCEELKLNNKDGREFTFVSHFFDEFLSKFCETFSKNEETIVTKTSNVQHLYNSFTGVLNNDYFDVDLIPPLHPTPAMGGTPTNLALSFIRENELFFRGYYASPLGWISPENSELYIGIRSALIRKTRMILFSGAGIVSGSDPTKEWKELDYKISQYLTNKKDYAKRECISYPKMGTNDYSRVASS